MITRDQQKAARAQAADMVRQTGIIITDAEADSIEVVDFGLSNLEKEGVQVINGKVIPLESDDAVDLDKLLWDPDN